MAKDPALHTQTHPFTHTENPRIFWGCFYPIFVCFWLLQYRCFWGFGSLHTHTDTHRHAQTHTDTHRHTQYVCVSVCDPPRHVYVSVIMSNSRKIVPFLVFEVPIFTKVLKRQDSDKTSREQLPKMLRFDLTRLSQIFFLLSISWNFDTSKFLCV